MNYFVMEMDWDGKKDKVIDTIDENEVYVFEYMEERGFERVENSPTLFIKGKQVIYVNALLDGDEPDGKPKLIDYRKTKEE